MALRVSHLVGAFPVLYEHAILEEISAVGREGVANEIVALHASRDPLPEAFDHLGSAVRWLDVGRRWGRSVGGAASALAGAVGLMSAPGRVRAWTREPSGMSPVSALWRRARLGRVLGRSKPDVVHAQFGHLGLFALPVVLEAGFLLVLSFRGQDVLLVRGVEAKARQGLFDYASRVLVRSEYMRDELIEMGCPGEKVFVQPSGTDVGSIPFRERGPAGEGPPVVLMAGRLVPKKGMGDGLAAVARSGSPVRVRIAGDGPEMEMLRRLASSLGLGTSVRFLGAIPHEGVIEEMVAADVFMLPARTAPDGEKEGVPNVLKEAQATGLPVLSARHAGIGECVAHGESGLLVEEGDIDGLADGLRRLLSEPGRWGAMGRCGRRLMEERYDLRVLAPRLVRHYGEVTGSAGSPSLDCAGVEGSD